MLNSNWIIQQYKTSQPSYNYDELGVVIVAATMTLRIYALPNFPILTKILSCKFMRTY